MAKREATYPRGDDGDDDGGDGGDRQTGSVSLCCPLRRPPLLRLKELVNEGQSRVWKCAQLKERKEVYRNK